MTLLDAITCLLPRLAENQRKIAQFILENPEKVLNLSSQQLAEVLDVSQSAIVKFSQKIGVKGYPALKLALSEIIGRQQLDDANPHIALHNRIAQEDNLMVVAQKLAMEKNYSITETTKHIDFKLFEKIVNTIDKSQRVQIVGIGGSGLTAKDLSYKLQKIGITTLVESDHHVQITAALTLNSNDTQIVISFSGKRKDMLTAASIGRKQGATIVAITRDRHSPLAQLSDYVLESIAEENEWRSSSISSRTAQNTLTDLLFMALLQKREAKAKSLVMNARVMINRLDE
ncbi:MULTISPECIES: SIS domain-containing protein [Providencia]|uniref:RpiR family transcriptional regulator n=1 Tax=Providencia heimbachae ATCC 35613 TaxID=1354272 RepID=A0A1B7JSF8_9GAMM|nr:MULTISPECIES: SIS domain-containing protein [Providencia]MBP6121527.1 SIS domain-containing protein [Providencia sp.]NIH21070.1 SIS domain-containing protein [Providencia heimbachae]OAT50839.1 RpiR family transcriptional regulator [Providencia heimbachae ATCC 35613]QCJ71923.1 SIS domain-containing protein [Providencia heimbachae]SQH11706.1 MurPQ operon repressor [Providencia heimbachae]